MAAKLDRPAVTATRTQLSDDAIVRFWISLHAELHAIGVPVKRRTGRAADAGWGRGYRILIDDIDRISCPDTGLFEPLRGITPAAYARRVRNAMRLTRAERQALELIRSGCEVTSHTRKVVTLLPESGKRHRVRQSTIDRLSVLGLIEEQATNESGTDVTYVAVQPRSVG